MPSDLPRVSIAIPVYNGAETIRACIDSALAQTYDGIEVVVVDNASTDDTVAIVAGYDDPRIRLHRNATNLGFLRNTNRAVELSRGELLKPLHADDRLLPRCVERMLALFDAHEHVGLVFSARQIEFVEPVDDEHRRWFEVYGRPERNFSGLKRVNDGRFLLAQYLRAGVPENWVGELSSMMVRRSSLQRVGLFGAKVGVMSDVELAVRMMAHFDIGFIDEELSVFRRGYGSLTGKIHADSWLDRVWMLEGIHADGEARERVAELSPALARERRTVARRLVRIARRRPVELPLRTRQAASYLAYAVRSALGRAPGLYPPLEPSRQS